MSEYVKVQDGTTIYVEDVGHGEPIIFLHGWPINNQMFEYQYNELLEKGYRIIGIDFRGFGRSEMVSENYNYDTLADDVRSVVEGLGVSDATLVGFSMGGGVAVRYMARHEGYGVKKLILLGAAAPIFTQRSDFPYGLPPEKVDTLIEQTKNDRGQMLKDFGEMVFNKEPSQPYKDLFTSLGWAASSYGTILSAIALRDEDMREDLPKISVPTMIGHGKQDQVCPFDLAEQMDKAIPNSMIVPFEESGHGMFHDEKDKLNKEMLSFIQGA